MTTSQHDKKRVAVIGAGIGGLSAAHALMRDGRFEIAVFERDARPGGVIHTSHSDGFMREHAVNGFLPVADGTGAIDLAHDLGVPIVEASPKAKNRWIYRHDALHALPSSPKSLLTTELLSLRGKLTLLAEPFRPRNHHANDADESIHAFASRRLGSEAADAMVAPFVTGVFAGDARALSVNAGFPVLPALEAKGGLLVGQVRTMFERARQRRADKARTARRKRPRLSAPRLGVQQLIDALARQLGDIVYTNAEVTGITEGPVVHLAGGAHHAFDALVLATPAHISARLLKNAAADLSQALKRILYAPIAAVFLGMRRADIAHPLDGFGFLVTEGERLRVLGTVFESVVWPKRAPHGCELLRCMFGGARDPDVLRLSDEELIALARADLDRALGGFANIPLIHTHVVRWPQAIAQYTLGHMDRVAHIERLAAPLGIVLAGSSYHGVAVNKIIADARRVTNAVASSVGVSPAVII